MLDPRPEWWNWELELSPHLLKRMVDRGFSETELRTMMEDAGDHWAAEQAGRFVVESRLDRRLWHVIVEPDGKDRLLVIVTAYPVH